MIGLQSLRSEITKLNLNHRLVNRFLCRKLTKRVIVSQEKVVKPVFYNAPKFQNRTAIYDATGKYTFSNLFVEAQELSMNISKQLNGRKNERVLFLCPNDASYVVTIWAIWMSGQIAVPLSHLHPENLLEYYINDTNSNLMVSAPQYQEKLDKLATKFKIKLHVLEENVLERSKTKNSVSNHQQDNVVPLDFYQTSNAMILYTSGTTGNPKGVVLTHKNLYIQTEILCNAWNWSHDDVILHTLPLHHVHGTINALFCPLSVGATTVMLPKFNVKEVWSYLLNQNKSIQEKVTVFMAVPTIYAKLVEEFEANLKKDSTKIKQFLTDNVRLMVSGSAPLPTPLHEKWFEISGHKLLERYGMTEICMCLSNLYDSNRSPGYVGLPLPSVSVALADPETNDILLECHNVDGNITINSKELLKDNVTGELLVKGDSIFKEYYNKPAETAKEFTQDGWFRTGDLSEYVRYVDKFRILGRTSVDIIKSGGYKISALQIETHLLAHTEIKECAVLGVSDDIYGERIAAVIVLKSENQSFDLDELRAWALDRMPRYWIPSALRIVDEIPKNAMGKINKKELKKTLFK